MAIKKYIEISTSGQRAEVTPNTTSAGAADGGKLVALDETTGKLDETLMPVGVVPLVKEIEASENLSAGDYVNVWNDGGTPKARKADATDTDKYASGYVLAAWTSGQTAKVYFEEFNNQLSGMTPGSPQYLSTTTPGGVQETLPAPGSGHLFQYLGQALSATEMSVEIDARGVIRG